jgi:hypothetical protein
MKNLRTDVFSLGARDDLKHAPKPTSTSVHHTVCGHRAYRGSDVRTCWPSAATDALCGTFLIGIV